MTHDHTSSMCQSQNVEPLFQLSSPGFYPRHQAGSVSVCSVAKSCLTLGDPVDCSPPGSSVLGIFRQEYQSGLPFPPPGDLPHPEIEARSPVSPALLVDSLPTKPLGKLQQVETSFLFTSSKEELLILCSVLSSLLSVTEIYYPELALTRGLATTRFSPRTRPPPAPT